MAAVFHILNHATFKAALVHVRGIIDHEAHTRDIRRLGRSAQTDACHLCHRDIAALSMAGIPLLNGFLSKEMMLEEANHTVLFQTRLGLVPVLATSARCFQRPIASALIGHVSLDLCATTILQSRMIPPAGLWLPPAILVVSGRRDRRRTVLASPLSNCVPPPFLGDAASVPRRISKFGTALCPRFHVDRAVVGGLIMLASFKPALRLWDADARPEAKSIFEAICRARRLDCARASCRCTMARSRATPRSGR